MSSTKTRGRPTPTQIIDTSTSPLISNITTTISAQTSAFQQQFVPSLLRIESVIPTRLNANRFQRVNRLITRSYSTLCAVPPTTANPFGLITNGGGTAAVPVTVNYKNVTKKINTNLQRHKNNQQQQQQQYQNGHESPSSKINNHQTTLETSCCIIAENGIQKVRRTPKEKDKQPDRINLDRRGLCQIPIIDNEPGLRLLSLQHNLINTFHVPEPQSGEVVACNNEDGVKDNNNNNLKDENCCGKLATTTTTTTIINNKLPAKPFLKQKSISRNQLNLNFSANNISTATTTSSTTTSTSSPNSAAAFLQKQFVFSPSTVQKHGVLKRANSVMINYTPSPTSSSPSTSVLNGNGGTTILAQRGKLVATPSFNSVVIDSGTHHEMATKSNSNSPDIQIDANNSYLNSFRFNLTNLVFLDLYNNQIEKISNLDGLKSLTVLLLGKNRITDISGIVSLRFTLRVLDLHGNRITSIAKICQLQELKSLNLAGNQLKQVQPGDFAGLQHLKELNLKRNRIKKINVSDDLHNLERLWLCHNELQNIEDMSSVAKSINLKEITIENNPISLAGDCVSFLVSYLPLLNTLNQLQITEQVRRAANAWRRNKENSDKSFQSLSTDVSSSIRREEIISNARTNWELIRQANITNNGRGVNQSRKFTKAPKLTPNNSSSSTSTASSSNNATNIKNSTRIEVVKRQQSRLLKSSSAENSSLVSDQTTDGECDYFHLPPVLDEFVEKSNNKNPSAASSTRPNIDSESSAFGSDSDDQKSFKSRIPTTPPIQRVASKPSTPVETIIIKEGEDDDKVEDKLPSLERQPVASSETIKKDEQMMMLTSSIVREKTIATLTIIDNNASGISLQPTTVNIETELQQKSELKTSSNEQLLKVVENRVENEKVSKTSAVKASSDSINTISSAAQDELPQPQQIQQHQGHRHNNNNITTPTTAGRTRSNSRKLGPPLVRSQTARNLSTHLNNGNNQQTNTNTAAGGLNTQNPSTGNNNQRKELKKETDKDRETGGDYLVEILGRYLNVYGMGAIKFVDKQWNSQKAQDVHTVKFSYINFNNISPILGRVKARFPNVEYYIFRETNFVCLGQLNAMADTQGLKSITIEAEGNPLFACKNWRTYAIYRLSHWGLKQINGVEISEDEIAEAETTYGGLSELVLWSLPDSLLQPLFTRLRVDEVILSNKMTPKEWLMKQADENIRQVVGKEALQWKKNSNTQTQQDELTVRRKGKIYFSSMMENTVNAVEKLQKLEYLWPNVLLELIRNTLIDYSQIDLYVRNLMSEVVKEKPEKAL